MFGNDGGEHEGAKIYMYDYIRFNVRTEQCLLS